MVREAAHKTIEQLPDLTNCGQTHGPTCQKQLNEGKSSNGLSINRSSMMEEVERHLVYRMMKSSRIAIKPFRIMW